MRPPPFIDVTVEPKLRRYVRRVIVTATETKCYSSAMIAPTGYAYIGWVYRGTMSTFVDELPHQVFTAPAIFIAGALDGERVRVDYSRSYGQVLAEFTATGLYELLQIGGKKVAGRASAIDELGVSGFQHLTTTWSERSSSPVYVASAFQQALCTFVPQATLAPDYVRHAVELFEAANGQIKIRDVAELTDVKPDRLRRQFQKVVGLSPKTFLGTLMLNQAMELLLRRSSGSLTELAHDAGYYDQAHFIRAVQKVVRDSPRDYIGSSRHFPDALFVREKN